MRHIFLVLSVIAVAACSSANKSEPAKTSPLAESPAAVKAAADKGAKPAPAAGAVECSFKTDKRILEVRAKDKGCELAYTKAGQENVIGSSVNGRDHCQQMSDKIKGKLETAGFSCK